jgi:hypothetical protein
MSSLNPLHRRKSSSSKKSVRREVVRRPDHRELRVGLEPLEKRLVFNNHFEFLGLSNGAAGTSELLTVEAVDTGGTILSSYNGTVDFSSTDPNLQGLPSSYYFSNTAIESFSITFETTGTQTITAQDFDNRMSSSSGPVFITAGSFDKFGFIGLQSDVAGTTQSFTVEAEDAYGNEVSNFSQIVSFSSTDPNATGLPPTYTFSTPSEILSIDFKTAGTQSITATDGGVTSSSNPVSITAGPFAKFGFIGLSNEAAGTTQSFTVEAEDTFGNEVSSFTSATVEFSSSDPNAIIPSSTFLFSSPSAVLPIDFRTAGTQTVYAADGTVTSSSNPVTITAGSFDKFGFIGLQSTVAGITQSFTVEAEDTYGNEVSSFSGTVDFSSTDPNAVDLPASYAFTSPAATLSIDFHTAGTQSLTAADPSATITSASNPVMISAGTFSKFGFIGLQNAAAGTPQAVTIEAEDAYGNETTIYAPVDYSSSDPQLSGLPTSSFFAGTQELFTITFKTAGTQSISANELYGSTFSSTPVTITAAAFDEFKFIGLENGAAGTPETLTVEAADTYGNELSSFSGTVGLLSSDPRLAGLPSISTFTTPQEIFTITFETAGTQTLYASDTITSASSPVTISAGDFDQFAFFGLSNAAAGTPETLTIEAEDTYGNELSNFFGFVSFSSSDPQLSGLPSMSTLFSPSVTFTITFETAGTQTITVTDQTVTSSSNPVTITAAAFHQFGFFGLEDGAAGTPQTLTVEAEDTYGNEVSSFSGTVNFINTTPVAGLPATSTFTSPSEIFTITYQIAGVQTLYGIDNGTITSTASPVTITHGAMDQFAFLGLTDGTAGTPQNVTIKAEDYYGNVVTDYDGSIDFASSDPQAVLPAEYTFLNSDDGTHVFVDGVTLETAGSQSVTVASTGLPAYYGLEVATVTPAAVASLSLSPSDTPGLIETVSITARDAYENIVTGYDATLDFGTSDPNAIFPASDTITGGEGSYLFTFSSTGTFSITANDSVNVGIDGGTLVTITKQETQAVSVSSPESQAFYGQNVTITASFSAPAVGDVPLTGTVDFYNGSTYLGSEPMVPTDPPATVNGQATYTLTLMNPGSYTITAVYSGNGNYSSATSNVPLTVSIAPATTSTTLSSNTTPQGTVLTASVVATSPGNPPITGNVAFYDGSTLLGVVPVVDGVATLNAGVLTGSHVFTATYSSDGTSATSGTTVNVSTDGPQIVGLSRLGFGIRPTVIVLTFDQPLNAATAQNPESYELFSSTGHRYALASVEYNPATLTVSIVPWQRLPIKGTFKLEVMGTGSNAVTNANGLALDGMGTGQPGSNFTTKFNWRALAAPDDSPAVVFENGQAIVNYQGGFTADYNAVYAATQFYLQHAVDRSGPLPTLAAKVDTAVHTSARPQVVFDVAPDTLKPKLVTTGMGLPKVSRHRYGHR